MARASQNTQQVVRTGLNPAYTAVTADGDIIDVGAVALHVKNGGAGACTVTVQTPLQVDGLDVSELVVSIPAGQERLIGPFSARTFGRPAEVVDAGRVYVDYSPIASVTRAVLKVS